MDLGRPAGTVLAGVGAVTTGNVDGDPMEMDAMEVTSMSAGRWIDAAALVIVVASSACGPRARESDTALRDSSGVTIAENAATDVALGWTFETDFVLGGADEGPEAWSGLDTEALGTDAAGDIYVLDTSAKRVVVFDGDGNLVRTLGGEGGGPGELGFPFRMAVSAEGEIWVADVGKGGYVRWGPDGTPLEEVKPFLTPPTGRQHYFTVSGGAMTVSTRVQAPDGDGTLYALRRIRGPDTTDIVMVVAAEPREVRMLECGGMLRLPPLFSPEIVWSQRDGALAVAASDTYAVDLYEGTALRRSIRRALPVRPASDDDAVRELGEGMRVRFGGNQPCVFPAERVVEQQGFAPTIPWVGSIGIDADGDVWVERRALGRDALGTIDVFDGEGRYLGTLADGTPFPVLFLPDGRVGVIEKDELDVPRLLVQRVERSGRG